MNVIGILRTHRNTRFPMGNSHERDINAKLSSNAHSFDFIKPKETILNLFFLVPSPISSPSMHNPHHCTLLKPLNLYHLPAHIPSSALQRAAPYPYRQSVAWQILKRFPSPGHLMQFGAGSQQVPISLPQGSAEIKQSKSVRDRRFPFGRPLKRPPHSYRDGKQMMWV